jgi:predicted homoserine dehydrogenase-like protein
MNLHRLARDRAAAGKPVKIALIGAGKFGSMFLNQIPTMPGVEIAVIADLDPDRACNACLTVGWDAARIARTRFVASGAEACADAQVEVVVEATGSPPAGIAHARAAIAAGKHIVMVNVEADVLAGPLLAEEARAEGVVYSLAYGDQPALTCEIVDWARACGFEVVAAGKGTKYLPAYHAVTPDDVWAYYGLTPDEAKRGGMNPQMFNSFLDGTKSAIEMAAIANASGLGVPHDGLGFPPCGVTTCRKSCAAATRSNATAWSRWSRAWSATGGRCSAICAGASMSCSRRQTITPAPASRNTASRPTQAAGTRRCTSPIT